MAASLTQIRNGIKAALAVIDGLSCYAIEPAKPHYPAAWTFPMRVDYHASFDGDLVYTMAVNVGVAASEIGHAQTNLDPYLAPSGVKSIVAALEAAPTLGGVADAVKVLGLTWYGVREIGGASAVVATFEVQVMA